MSVPGSTLVIMAFATEHPVLAHSEYRAVDDVVRAVVDQRRAVEVRIVAARPVVRLHFEIPGIDPQVPEHRVSAIVALAHDGHQARLRRGEGEGDGER